MPQFDRYFKTYRGWRIVRVFDRTVSLYEGPKQRELGFMPRLNLARKTPQRRSPSLMLDQGQPRSLREVEDWIDRIEDNS